ncbi:MAG: RNA methyltransferase [Bacteroidetes bacterium]|nr:RNA methyltransferase [Bacteroidota bacterium]
MGYLIELYNYMTPERQLKFNAVLENRQANLAVVMENVHDLHNISAVMRTCDAVGIQDIYIINTIIAKHPRFGPKSSSSAEKWLTVHQFDSVSDCVKVLRERYQKIYTTHLSADAVDLYDIDFATSSVALVFGNEHDGVSEEIRNLADGNFIIPQVGMIQSLNISVACAISIYEAFRQKRLSGHYLKASLSTERMEQLTNTWTEPKAKFTFKDRRATKY